MSSNGFRLPCLYCNEEVTFDSSHLLKEHLMKAHGELVSSTSDSSYGSIDLVGKRGCRPPPPPPPVTLYKMSENNTLLPYQSSSLLFSQKLQKDASVHSATSTINRLNDVIYKKDEEIQRLWSVRPEFHTQGYEQVATSKSAEKTGDSIRCEQTRISKDKVLRDSELLQKDEQIQRQWSVRPELHTQGYEQLSSSKSAEKTGDSMRCEQTRIIEDKVLRDSELLQKKIKEFEKSNSRHDENIIEISKMDVLGLAVEEMHDVKTKLSHPSLRENPFGKIGDSHSFLSMIRDGTSIEKENMVGFDGKVNTKDMQTIKSECPPASSETVLGRIEDTHSFLPISISHQNEEVDVLRKELENEKQENASLKKNLQDVMRNNDELRNEKTTTSGDAKEEGNSTSLYDTKNKEIMALIKRVEEENQDLNMQLNFADEIKEDLEKKVKTLHEEKEKLVERLKSADEAFCKISTRVSMSPQSLKSADNSSPAERFMLSQMNKQLKSNLDEIARMVSQIPTKEQVSSRQELSQIKDELHRVTLLLAEEKRNHEQLKRSSAELEETLKIMSENEDQRTKICEDLTLLRTKHKKCNLIESALKQSRREKKVLLRKYENLRRKFELLKILHETLKEGLTSRNTSKGEEENNVADKDIRDALVAQLRNELAERDLVIKEYEGEHYNLVDKLESTCKELDELRKINSDLKSKQEISIEALNDSLKHMNICITDLHSDKDGKRNELELENAKLSIDLSYLRQNVSETEAEVETLQGKVNALEIIKLSNESEIASLREALESLKISQQKRNVNQTSEKYTTIIENLNLEKDILSSRVLILEGIGEELKILRKEKEKLKEINEELKRKLDGNKFKAKNSFSDGDINIASIGYVADSKNNADNIEFNAKNLNDLNEREKSRLQSMLSNPLFDPLSSPDTVYLEELDMPIRESNVSKLPSDENEKSLGRISNISSDHVINETSSAEYVQNIHLPIHSECAADDTINYVNGGPDTVFEKESSASQTCNSSSNADVKKVVSKKKKFLGKLKKGKKVKKLTRKDSPITKYSEESVDNLPKEIKKQKSPNKIKHVQFSDKLLEITEEHEEENVNDIAFFKSYYQECLKKEYPILAEYSDEHTEKELVDDMSNESPRSTSSGSLSPMNPVMQGLESDSNDWCSRDLQLQEFPSSKCDQGYESTASNLRSSTSCNVSYSGNGDNEYPKLSTSHALDLGKFNNKKEFEEFIKYHHAKLEFSEKKRDASDALKVLKSLMTKAGKLQNEASGMSDGYQPSKVSQTNSNLEGVNNSDTMENRVGGEANNNRISIKGVKYEIDRINTDNNNLTSTPVNVCQRAPHNLNTANN